VKTKVTIITHEQWYTLLKFVDDRIGLAQLTLQRHVMTKIATDWFKTPIPMLTEYYSTLYLLKGLLEEPYKSADHYAKKKQKITEQGKEGIPIEQNIFDQITNYVTIVDVLKGRLETEYDVVMKIKNNLL